MQQSKKIAIVEDDPDIAELIQLHLERAGYLTVLLENGKLALEYLESHPVEAIILDIMLPGMSGIEVCRTLKHNDRFAKTPIIFLSAKGEESDVLKGLEIGADDYVKKPFSPAELVARVKAVTRRTVEGAQAADAQNRGFIEVGPFSLDTLRHEFKLKGQVIKLTLAEFNIIEALLSNPGVVLSRDKIIDKMTGGEITLMDRNVDVHIRSIRKKLGEHAELIQTIRGVGYKCQEEQSSASPEKANP